MTEAWIKEFVGCFDSVDKDGTSIEKGYMIKHQHLPKCVYKYREVNNFSLKNLDEGTVWLTSPSKYNDPYDCAATMSYSELVKATPPAELKRLIQGSRVQSVLSPNEIEEALSASDPAMEVVRKILAKSVPNDKIDDMIKALKEAQDHVMAPHIENVVQSVRDGIKVCSFCATFEPILMWSHYASNHQGFCMEYEVAAFPSIAKRMFFPVIYDSSCSTARSTLPEQRLILKDSTIYTPSFRHSISHLNGHTKGNGVWYLSRA